MHNFSEFIEHHSTCFGRSFRQSSGVQDCTYSISYMSYMFVDCMLTWCIPDDVCTLLNSWWWRKDHPKHVEWYSINSKKVHLVGFTIETLSASLVICFYSYYRINKGFLKNEFSFCIGYRGTFYRVRTSENQYKNKRKKKLET
jgi:hypothetical protein